MSIKGLEQSEAIAKSLDSRLKRTLNAQKRLLREEIDRIQYLLADRQALMSWRNQPANAQKLSRILQGMTEVEQLYLTAGQTRAAQIFKQRMQKQLQTRLTNLKANELEVQITTRQYEIAARHDMLNSFNRISNDARLTEMYTQARQGGGFLSNFGKAYLPDLITLETKAAGSKTLGEYMRKLFNTYETALKDVFVKGIVRGDSYRMMINNLTQATKITAGKANLLITTEANAIFNESVKDVIDANPLVKGYRFRAVLDGRTSDICQKQDGKYIPKDQVKPGINYPPLHPRCRSTVTTVLATENEKRDTMQRYTKNGSNQWVPVPPGMTYPQFKERIGHFSNLPTGYSPPTPASGKGFSSTVLRERISANDPRIELRGTTRIVPNVVASAAQLDNKMTNRMSPAAIKAYDTARSSEPEITNTLLNVVDSFEGAKLDGVEFSVKTASSVEEKVFRKQQSALADGLKPLPDDEIIKQMTDVVRYTQVVDHDSIVDATFKTEDLFQKKGFEIVERDNKYALNDPSYKGVHLLVKDKKGVAFEVQVHSKESMAIKNANHILYEEARILPKGDQRRAILEEQMKQNSRSLQNPKGIDKLKSYNTIQGE